MPLAVNLATLSLAGPTQALIEPPGVTDADVDPGNLITTTPGPPFAALTSYIEEPPPPPVLSVPAVAPGVD